MPRWPEKKEKAVSETIEKKNANPVYYCVKGQYVFSIPVYERDEMDEVVMVNGKPKKEFVSDSDGNNRHEVKQSFKFDRLPVIDAKTGKADPKQLVGIFIISPEFPDRWERKDDIIDYIEKARKNKYNHLVTEDEYKSLRNPEAYIKEKEVSALRLSNDQLFSENERIKKVLAEKGISIE